MDHPVIRGLAVTSIALAVSLFARGLTKEKA